ncbi:hypothetical protein BofuT4_uP042270.1 [Botrytis cinerea T4]|uniref:Uncharacterized protein n=1 Tax=Botryotinia fuckeliana (strain T4) TaxID=999810 RepID=G2Y1S6_BOTF4|nr:hypothetical protein BofuT4_uP042270.1 [Botrytis cinerea T4]
MSDLSEPVESARSRDSGRQSDGADVGVKFRDWCSDDEEDVSFPFMMSWLREKGLKFGLEDSEFERDIAVGELKGVSGTLSGE